MNARKCEHPATTAPFPAGDAPCAYCGWPLPLRRMLERLDGERAQVQQAIRTDTWGSPPMIDTGSDALAAVETVMRQQAHAFPLREEHDLLAIQIDNDIYEFHFGPPSEIRSAEESRSAQPRQVDAFTHDAALPLLHRIADSARRLAASPFDPDAATESVAAIRQTLSLPPDSREALLGLLPGKLRRTRLSAALQNTGHPDFAAAWLELLLALCDRLTDSGFSANSQIFARTAAALAARSATNLDEAPAYESLAKVATVRAYFKMNAASFLDDALAIAEDLLPALGDGPVARRARLRYLAIKALVELEQDLKFGGNRSSDRLRQARQLLTAWPAGDDEAHRESAVGEVATIQNLIEWLLPRSD